MTTPTNTTAPNWTPIQYVNSADLNPDVPQLVDATVFGDGGFSGQDKLGTSWTLQLILNHMIVPGTNPPAYDPTHDFLQARGVGQLGAANRVQLRMYDFDTNDITGVVTPRGQAYMGFANYSWPMYGATAQAVARMVTIPFVGKGKLNPIVHPYALAATAPVLSSVTPNTAPVAGGKQFTIRGGQLAGVTGITVGGTAVLDFTPIDSGRIIATVPAKAAGAYPVVVTTPAGSSSSTPTAANTITFS